eukprot:TRINITY_DN13965_c0_g1_i1.p1 TRINITY_DN13965_c0_g1~~TRINITY_DN13965_c0_g1_i1.p1  ORF type:complete len:219 (+),score=31.97 TRINITY_DN13965_c0_g1_i1:46-702(+)
MQDIEDLKDAKRQPEGVLASVDDLCEEDRKLPAYALRGRLHKLACERGLEGYRDPIDGQVVASKDFLVKRECCGDKCRHCPHKFVNVPKKAAVTDARSSSLSSSQKSEEAGSNQHYTMEFPPPIPLNNPPLSITDAFTPEELKSTPSYALKGKLHRAARERKVEAYIDPAPRATPLAVFTVDYLKSLPECCGHRCTHCPYGYMNCKLPDDADSDSSSD